jgi:hypothetical protein
MNESNKINNDLTNTNTKPKSNKRIFKNHYSVPFVVTLMCITSWIFGYGNIQLIRYWYVFSMCLILGIRISEFVEIKYHHFLIEMCYYVNILTMYVVLMNYDIRIVYPFTHGPLLFYCVIFGDAPIPDRLSRVITFAVHCYSALVSRKIYWSENFFLGQHITWDDFIVEIVRTFKIYFVWFLFYSVYLLKYNGNSDNMIRYIFKIDKQTIPSIKTKLLYLLIHITTIMLTCSIGILFRYNYLVNIFAIGLMILSSIYQTGKFYYKHRVL